MRQNSFFFDQCLKFSDEWIALRNLLPYSMRIVVLFCLCLSSRIVVAQDLEQDSVWYNQKRWTVEMMIAPLYVYNAAGFGLGRYGNSNEHLLDLNAFYIPLGQEEFNLGLHYSYHRYITTVSANFHPYLAFWTGIRRKNVANYVAGDGPYYDECDLRAGIGFGGSYSFLKGRMMRFDLGIGAAYHMENMDSDDNASAFPFQLQFSRFSTSQDIAVLPAFKLRIRYQFNLSR